jgi:hypothetical protein
MSSPPLRRKSSIIPSLNKAEEIIYARALEQGNREINDNSSSSSRPSYIARKIQSVIGNRNNVYLFVWACYVVLALSSFLVSYHSHAVTSILRIDEMRIATKEAIIDLQTYNHDSQLYPSSQSSSFPRPLEAKLNYISSELKILSEHHLNAHYYYDYLLPENHRSMKVIVDEAQSSLVTFKGTFQSSSSAASASCNEDLKKSADEFLLHLKRMANHLALYKNFVDKWLNYVSITVSFLLSILTYLVSISHDNDAEPKIAMANAAKLMKQFSIESSGLTLSQICHEIRGHMGAVKIALEVAAEFAIKIHAAEVKNRMKSNSNKNSKTTRKERESYDSVKKLASMVRSVQKSVPGDNSSMSSEQNQTNSLDVIDSVLSSFGCEHATLPPSAELKSRFNQRRNSDDSVGSGDGSTSTNAAEEVASDLTDNFHEILDVIAGGLLAVEEQNNVLNNRIDMQLLMLGSYKHNPEKIDVVQLCKGMLPNTFYNQSGTGDSQIGGHIDFSVKCEYESLWVELDIFLIKRALMNLLSNARKNTSRGTVVIDITIEEETNENEEDENNDDTSQETKVRKQQTLVFTVIDTGHGIRADRMKSLFDSENDNKLIDKRGSGLGLPYVALIARTVGGNIKIVSSEVSKGSIFAFSLPVIVVENGTKNSDDSNNSRRNSVVYEILSLSPVDEKESIFDRQQQKNVRGLPNLVNAPPSSPQTMSEAAKDHRPITQPLVLPPMKGDRSADEFNMTKRPTISEFRKHFANYDPNNVEKGGALQGPFPSNLSLLIVDDQSVIRKMVRHRFKTLCTSPVNLNWNIYDVCE